MFQNKGLKNRVVTVCQEPSLDRIFLCFCLIITWNLENVQTQSFAYQAGGNFLGKQKYLHNFEIPFCKIIF